MEDCYDKYIINNYQYTFMDIREQKDEGDCDGMMPDFELKNFKVYYFSCNINNTTISESLNLERKMQFVKQFSLFYCK